MPAQPADFQAEAESDTRIQLSWLLPPQERIIKYELVYWAAEDEGQQVSTQQGQEKGRRLLLVPEGLWWAHPGRPFWVSVVVWVRPLGFSLGLCGSCSLYGSTVFYSVLGTKSLCLSLHLAGSDSHDTSRVLKFPWGHVSQVLPWPCRL